MTGCGKNAVHFGEGFETTSNGCRFRLIFSLAQAFTPGSESEGVLLPALFMGLSVMVFSTRWLKPTGKAR